MRTAPHKLPAERKVQAVIAALQQAYGEPVLKPGDPLAVLIRGILSQNTSDTNSGRAFDELMGKFGSWDAIATADASRIARVICGGGLAEQKAKTIKAVMAWLEGKDGWQLEFLREMPPEAAEKELSSIKGVGIKTARLVLLFGFGLPVFVVDTHVHRVARRLGLIDAKCGRERAHEVLDRIVPDDRKYSAHMNLIRHGRECCRSRSPLCPDCPVSRWCVFVREAGLAAAH